MPVDPEVLEKMRALIADVLGAELDEVAPAAWFDADLGGESIDLLDLGFRCEKAFGVKIRFQDLTAQDLAIGTDGTLTAESLHRLSQRFPLLEVSHWTNRKFDRPLQLLTVGDIAAVVESEIRQSQISQVQTSVDPDNRGTLLDRNPALPTGRTKT